MTYLCRTVYVTTARKRCSMHPLGVLGAPASIADLRRDDVVLGCVGDDGSVATLSDYETNDLRRRYLPLARIDARLS